MTSFEVVADELTTHASHVDGLADRLGTAQDAAKTVGMSDQAYGLLCQFLPPFISPMEEKASAAIDAATDAVKTTAENVRTTASDYQEGDEAQARPFDGGLAT